MNQNKDNRGNRRPNNSAKSQPSQPVRYREVYTSDRDNNGRHVKPCVELPASFEMGNNSEGATFLRFRVGGVVLYDYRSDVTDVASSFRNQQQTAANLAKGLEAVTKELTAGASAEQDQMLAQLTALRKNQAEKVDAFWQDLTKSFRQMAFCRVLQGTDHQHTVQLSDPDEGVRHTYQLDVKNVPWPSVVGNDPDFSKGMRNWWENGKPAWRSPEGSWFDWQMNTGSKSCDYLAICYSGSLRAHVELLSADFGACVVNVVSMTQDGMVVETKTMHPPALGSGQTVVVKELPDTDMASKLHAAGVVKTTAEANAPAAAPATVAAPEPSTPQPVAAPALAATDSTDEPAPKPTTDAQYVPPVGDPAFTDVYGIARTSVEVMRAVNKRAKKAEDTAKKATAKGKAADKAKTKAEANPADEQLSALAKTAADAYEEAQAEADKAKKEADADRKFTDTAPAVIEGEVELRPAITEQGTDDESVSRTAAAQ